MTRSISCLLDGIQCHRRLPPAFCHFGTVRVKCLAQEHNRMTVARSRTCTTQSGVQQVNHLGTASPNWSDRIRKIFIRCYSNSFQDINLQTKIPGFCPVFCHFICTSYHASDQSQEEAVPKHFETSPNAANFDSYRQKERDH